jgi:hypothetical protein
VRLNAGLFHRRPAVLQRVMPRLHCIATRCAALPALRRIAQGTRRDGVDLAKLAAQRDFDYTKVRRHSVPRVGGSSVPLRLGDAAPSG